MYVAPVGTPENFEATPEKRTVTFFWSPPTVSAPISSYTLSCDPSPSTLPLTFAEAGKHSITGFYPDSCYDCSVIANYDSSLSGTPTTIDFYTKQDCKYSAASECCVLISISPFPFSIDLEYNITLAGYIKCSRWLVSFNHNHKC